MHTCELKWYDGAVASPMMVQESINGTNSPQYDIHGRNSSGTVPTLHGTHSPWWGRPAIAKGRLAILDTALIYRYSEIGLPRLAKGRRLGSAIARGRYS